MKNLAVFNLLITVCFSLNARADEIYLVREPTGQCRLQVPDGPFNPEGNLGIHLDDLLAFINKSPRNLKILQEVLGTTAPLQSVLKSRTEKNGFVRIVGNCEGIDMKRAQIYLTDSGVFGSNPTMTCHFRTRSWKFIIPSTKFGPYMKVYENHGVIRGRGEGNYVEELAVVPIKGTRYPGSSTCPIALTLRRPTNFDVRFCLSNLARGSSASYHNLDGSPQGPVEINCSADKGFEEALQPHLTVPTPAKQMD